MPFRNYPGQLTLLFFSIFHYFGHTALLPTCWSICRDPTLAAGAKHLRILDWILDPGSWIQVGLQGPAANMTYWPKYGPGRTDRLPEWRN